MRWSGVRTPASSVSYMDVSLLTSPGSCELLQSLPHFDSFTCMHTYLHIHTREGGKTVLLNAIAHFVLA